MQFGRYGAGVRTASSTGTTMHGAGLSPHPGLVRLTARRAIG